MTRTPDIVKRLREKDKKSLARKGLLESERNQRERKQGITVHRD